MGYMLILTWVSETVVALYTDGLNVNTEMGNKNGESTIYRWVIC